MTEWFQDSIFRFISCQQNLQITLLERAKREELKCIAKFCIRNRVVSFNLTACVWFDVFNHPTFREYFFTRREAMIRLYQVYIP